MVRILSIDRLYSRSKLSARSLAQSAGGGLIGVLARAARVERRRRVEVRHRIAAHEFGHLDDPALVGLGKRDDLARGDELLDRDGRGPNIAHQSVGRAVVGGQGIEDPANQFATASDVVDGNRHSGKERSPQLTGDHTHLDLDPVGLALGFREHFLGRDPRVELEIQLLDEAVAADPP